MFIINNRLWFHFNQQKESFMLALQYDLVFGLAFDVALSEHGYNPLSGFMPAERCLSAGMPLYGDLRLQAFKEAAESGFAHKLLLVGGDEKRPECDGINRAEAIHRMLIRDLDVYHSRVEWKSSVGHTAGNVEVITKVIEERRLVSGAYAVMSNHYHVPRIILDFALAGIPMPVISAEAVWLAASISDDQFARRKQLLLRKFGNGEFVERVVEEIQGIAHKIRGQYKSVAHDHKPKS